MRALPYIEGGFGTVVADPPWDYTAGKATRIKPPYATMTLAEIGALPVADLAAQDALLFLWTTSSFTEDAYKIMRAWGFAPKSQIVWVKIGETGKLQIGMGSYVRMAHEICLIGRRGKATGLVRNIPSVIIAPREEHSRKPDVLLEIAEHLSPGPRLEMFARRARKGWHAWGLEAPATKAPSARSRRRTLGP